MVWGYAEWRLLDVGLKCLGIGTRKLRVKTFQEDGFTFGWGICG